jgi:hypothetical protein
MQEEYLHLKYVAEQLREVEDEAVSPEAEWTDSKTVIRALREKYHGQWRFCNGV